MKKLTRQFIQTLLAKEQEPCLSLYMPTHRSHPDNLSDATVFKGLVKNLEKSLATKYTPKEVNELIQPFELLAQDKTFWNHTLGGLAVFGNVDYFETIQLPIRLRELAIVADTFHTKPLRHYLQSEDNYYILGLGLHSYRMFEGNRHSLSEVIYNHEEVLTIKDALGHELTEKHSTVASYGGAGGQSNNMHHGHGGRSDELDNDSERFFRFVSKEVEENYSRLTGWPIILASLAEHQNLFQKVNKNAAVLPQGISINPDSLQLDTLAEMAWEVIEPAYIEKLQKLARDFEQAQANGKGSTVIKDVAVAAVDGRIDTLLIESDRIIEARITNLVTGNMQKKAIDNPKVDDLLDDIGELVSQMGGVVVVYPKDQIPSETGLAAIFRY